MDDGNKGTRRTYQNDEPVVNNITAPATDAARQWSGWGTALKPAWEPIIVARKPLCGTVAETVLRHGTGALNIDGCRAGARWPANVAHDGIMHEHGRYFYCAKTSKADRNDGCDDMALCNHHPTVKPTELMRYLVRLVTPPGGVVLDPFCGSGSTGRGAILEQAAFIGIELDADYLEIARRRINACLTPMEVLL
jgi:site-specific DNA-methyltransferase (adenine-specific)